MEQQFIKQEVNSATSTAVPSTSGTVKIEKHVKIEKSIDISSDSDAGSLDDFINDGSITEHEWTDLSGGDTKVRALHKHTRTNVINFISTRLVLIFRVQAIRYHHQYRS